MCVILCERDRPRGQQSQRGRSRGEYRHAEGSMDRIVIAGMLLGWLLACATGGQKPAPAKPAPAPAPAPSGSPGQPGGIDWGAKIGGSIDVGSQSDKIGAAGIETASLGGPGSAPKVAEYLEDPSPGVRRKAVDILSRWGAEARGALPQVLRVLRNADPRLRQDAAEVAAQLGVREAADGLRAALDDKNAAVAAWARAGLVKLGEPCPEHLLAAAKIVREGDAEAARQAAAAMALMKCPSPEAVRELIGALSREGANRASAARALGPMGAAAGEAVPVLMGLVKDKDAATRQAVLIALTGIGAPAVGAVPLLIEVLADPAPRFRELAANALGAIGPGARQAIPALNKATLDNEGSVQLAARRALAAIQGAPQP